MDSTAPKIGIVVYSRSGHSLRLAHKLAKALDAVEIELAAPAFKGGFGYMRAGFESLKQTRRLAPQSFVSLIEYDHIIVCGPVWTSYPATPLRGLLAQIALPQSVSLFLTSGAHSPATKAFDAGAADLGRPFMATASLANGLEGTPQEDRIFDRFLSDVETPHAELEMAQFDALQRL